MHIALDELHFTSVYKVEEDTTLISKPTGNSLRRITFTVRYQGLDLKEQIAEILKKTSFTFKTVGSDPVEFKAKGSQSYSYTGSSLDDDTIISATITVEELDKDLPEDHNPLAMMAEGIIMNWIRTRALSSILIKNGLCTEDEYIQEIEEIRERDFDNLRKLMAYGIPEPDKK